MEQIYNSDKPIDNKNKDRFNRNKFSSRISQTIINRKSDEGLVIGLYGVWGEGKTSVPRYAKSHDIAPTRSLSFS